MNGLRRVLILLAGLIVILGVTWAVAIGPVAVWRVVTHGTTTVWDHLEYPGRELSPSPASDPWAHAADRLAPPDIVLGDDTVPLETLLAERDALAFVVIRDGELAYEWYAPGHGADTPSMVFSVTKSILSLLVGAAIDDGLIGSVEDRVTVAVPELSARGFADVTLEDLLRMDSGSNYVENDNPFGAHVEFNYTDDLAGSILQLRVRDRPDPEFRYKSGDSALLGLVLDRVLEGRTITEYMQDRLWDPLGMEHGGVWSTDRADGLERVFCCLALTARDLARFGQLIVDDGMWGGERLLPSAWLEASFSPAYEPDRWAVDYRDTPLVNYGYQWWLTEDAMVATGKDGQYLYVDWNRRVVVVRLGESQGGIGWFGTVRQVAEATG